MKYDPIKSLNRRQFVRQSVCAAFSSQAILHSLAHLQDVAAATATQSQLEDYKALVCIFLFGGNDTSNVLIPNDTSGYNDYAATRSILALPNANLNPITPQTPDPLDPRTWALHPNFTDVKTLFDASKLAFVANVGTLVVPTTREQYKSGAVPLPPQIFSHNDQQVQWMTSVPDSPERIGWGGRTADSLEALNENSQVSMSISLAGTNVFQIGKSVLQYHIDANNGSIGLSGFGGAGSPNNQAYHRLQRFQEILSRQYHHPFEQTQADIINRAIDNDAAISGALSSLDAQNLPVFDDANWPVGNPLAAQLRMALKMIAIRSELNQKRQIYFVALGGWDTHGDQLADHNYLLGEVNDAVKTFYDATVTLGVDSLVTGFTISDFGRTFTSNGKGSDHGWGSHQMVFGSAVNGGEIYGTMPQLIVDGPDDTGRGRWIPTLAVDQMAATLVKWFGVPQSEMASVLPNLGRFNAPDLGFMKPG